MNNCMAFNSENIGQIKKVYEKIDDNSLSKVVSLIQLNFRIQVQDMENNPILINNKIWPYIVDKQNSQFLDQIPYPIILMIQTIYFPGQYKFLINEDICEQLNLYPQHSQAYVYLQAELYVFPQEGFVQQMLDLTNKQLAKMIHQWNINGYGSIVQICEKLEKFFNQSWKQIQVFFQTEILNNFFYTPYELKERLKNLWVDLNFDDFQPINCQSENFKCLVIQILFFKMEAQFNIGDFDGSLISAIKLKCILQTNQLFVQIIKILILQKKIEEASLIIQKFSKQSQITQDQMNKVKEVITIV